MQVTSPYLEPGTSPTIVVPGMGSHTLRLTTEVRTKTNQIEQTKSVNVRALDGDIMVFGVNTDPPVSEGYVGLPVEMLGRTYVVTTPDPSGFGRSQVTLVSVDQHHDTRVSITLPRTREVNVQYKDNLFMRGQLFTINLHGRETLEMTSSQDLTGMVITADRRLAVFSGNKQTVSDDTKTKQHLISQLTPVDTWGTKFVATGLPFEQSDFYFIKVVASQSGTRVTIEATGHNISLSQAGDSEQYRIASNINTLITSNKPTQVVIFYLNPTNSQSGEASMLLLPPIEQFSNSFAFAVPHSSGGDFENYAVILIDQSKSEGVHARRNQQEIAVPRHHAQLVPGSQMAAIPLPLEAGSYQIFHNPSDVRFLVLLYGRATGEAYAYPAGMNLYRTNKPVSVIRNRKCMLYL